MAFLRPNADAVDGAWTNQAGSNVNLFDALDESVALDTDYIQSPANPVAETCRVALSDPTGLMAEPFVVRYRFNNLGGSQLIVRLLQGTTEIAVWTETSVGWTTQARTLTSPQFAAMGGVYTDLLLEFTATVGSAILDQTGSPILDEAGQAILAGTEIQTQYSYHHSMWSHDGVQGVESAVPYWLDAMVEAGETENTYQWSGLAGQLDTYPYPPTGHQTISGVTQPAGLANNSWSGCAAINNLVLTPDNFDGWQVAPNSGDANLLGSHDSYAAGYSTVIQAWATNAPNAVRRYAIYQPLKRFSEATADDIAQATQADKDEWIAAGLTQYSQWFLDLEDLVQEANPTLDIELWRVGDVVSQTIAGVPALDALDPDELFLDAAPHQLSTSCLLASAVIYMYAFNKQPTLPAAAAATHAVNTALTSNWAAVMSYAWNLVVAAAPSVDPVLSGISVDPSQTTATLDWSTNEFNGTAYWMVDTNATRTAAQVITGGGVDSGSVAVTTGGAQADIIADSLTAATGYYFHLMHEDASGNRSTVSSTGFTTDAASAEGATATYLGVAYGDVWPATTWNGTINVGSGASGRQIVAVVSLQDAGCFVASGTIGSDPLVVDEVSPITDSRAVSIVRAQPTETGTINFSFVCNPHPGIAIAHFYALDGASETPHASESNYIPHPGPFETDIAHVAGGVIIAGASGIPSGSAALALTNMTDVTFTNHNTGPFNQLASGHHEATTTGTFTVVSEASGSYQAAVSYAPAASTAHKRR